ncbi:MAG: transglycosylase domain-containing protein [Saprospiraceae bacterium]
MPEHGICFYCEVKYTKQNILESYLNEIYLGQAGFVSIYGVSEAAHRYSPRPFRS